MGGPANVVHNPHSQCVVGLITPDREETMVMLKCFGFPLVTNVPDPKGDLKLSVTLDAYLRLGYTPTEVPTYLHT